MILSSMPARRHESPNPERDFFSQFPFAKRGKVVYHMTWQLLISGMISMIWQNQAYHIWGCFSIKNLVFSKD
jgi:hypothetical protein